jgi:hypothetical protein
VEFRRRLQTVATTPDVLAAISSLENGSG